MADAWARSWARVTGYRGDGPFNLNPGEWTDDTSMALALADSLSLHDMDLEDQAHRYLAWMRDGKYSVNGRCFDIGNATRAARSTASIASSNASSMCTASAAWGRTGMVVGCWMLRHKLASAESVMDSLKLLRVKHRAASAASATGRRSTASGRARAAHAERRM